MRKFYFEFTKLVLICSVLLLAACGGGSGGGSDDVAEANTSCVFGSSKLGDCKI